MYGCYFSYYFMIAGVGLALLIRNRDHFHHFITVVSLVFYVCYLTYVVLPVMGPRIFFHDGLSVTALGGEDVQHPRWGVLAEDPPPYPEAIREGVFYNVVAFLYRYFESEGAALPSRHVALALVTLYFSWIYLPRVRWLHLMFAVGLWMSTVYCRFHYVVDVFAGLALAALLVPMANRLHRKWKSQTSSPPS
jgi:membrane-associated phospholipid phosphatase